MACLIENGVIEKAKKRCRDIQVNCEIGRRLFEFTQRIADHDKLIKTSVVGYSFGEGLVLLAFAPATDVPINY